MKLSRWFVGASLLLATVGATPILADNFRPRGGVRRDESARVCYERGVPSVEMTECYFGHRAAKRLARDLPREERGYGACAIPNAGCAATTPSRFATIGMASRAFI